MMTPTSSSPPRCNTTTECANAASSNPWLAISTVTRSPCCAQAAWVRHSIAAPRRSATTSFDWTRAIVAMARSPSVIDETNSRRGMPGLKCVFAPVPARPGLHPETHSPHRLHPGRLDCSVVKKVLGWGTLALVCACATGPQRVEREALPPLAWPDDSHATQLLVLNRISFGPT